VFYSIQSSKSTVFELGTWDRHRWTDEQIAALLNAPTLEAGHNTAVEQVLAELHERLF